MVRPPRSKPQFEACWLAVARPCSCISVYHLCEVVLPGAYIGLEHFVRLITPIFCESLQAAITCRLSGYDYRFGIIHVDYTGGLVRYAKESAMFLAAWFSGAPLQGSSTVSSSSIG